jgi:hypothetical protein
MPEVTNNAFNQRKIINHRFTGVMFGVLLPEVGIVTAGING